MKATITNYNSTYHTTKATALSDVKKAMKKSGICWIHFQKLPDLDKFQKAFKLHPLVIEDITTKDQRPKIETYDDYALIILKKLSLDKDHIRKSQFSIILKKNCLITYSTEKAPFDKLRDRMKKNHVPKKLDYLAYAILDTIVDCYFSILENYGVHIEKLEDHLFGNPSQKTLKELHKARRDIMKMRSMIWPLREVINEMARGEIKLIQKVTLIHLRDLYDHTVQVMDGIENYREMLSGMLDIYLSSISNKMNEIMKVLTVISTIFIPLTFITGVYGMNFIHMPELKQVWAYPSVWAVMIGIGILMLIYFKRKEWL